VITILDETAPEISGIPADVTVECDEIPTEDTEILQRVFK